ncbi:MAG: Ig-like domain-containing protein [Litorilinea sp.]
MLLFTAACAPASSSQTTGTDSAPRAGVQRILTTSAPAALAQTENDLPPALRNTTPTGGALRADTPVTFEFDQELDPVSADALTIQPDLPGTVTVEGARLTFLPTAPPVAGEPYQFLLPAGTIVTSQGIASTQDVEATFTGATPLAVTSVQPSDATGEGAEEVAPDTAIVVVFNRPVIPLGGIDETAALPAPLTIEPEIAGEGEWLNTSIYTFRPSVGFAGATRYTVTVADVTALDGETLEAPFVFEFTTAAPIVTNATPVGSGAFPESTVEVTFSQPMDPASTAAAFQLTAENRAIDGALSWHDNDTRLVFTPTQSLEFGSEYTIQVAETAQPISRQGNLRAAFSQAFQVVPLPAIERVSPADGAQNISPDASVVIKFNTALSDTLVYDNISVTPLLTTTQVFSYYSGFVNELQLSWFKEPNTTYTVTVGADTGDRYGNTLGADQTYTFTTGDYAPVVQYEIERFTHFMSQGAEPRTSLLFRNVDAIEADFYRVPLPEFFRLTGTNQWEIWENYTVPDAATNRIWSRTYEGVEERNVTVRQVISLTAASGDLLPPGVYYLESPDPGAALRDGDMNVNPKQNSLIVLSDYNLLLKASEFGESLVWLTEYATGAPVPDATVQFYIDGEQVGAGATDSDGILRIQLNLTPENRWKPLIAVVSEPGAPDFAIASSEWNSGIAVWDFELMGGWGMEPIQQFFYTDRAVYRAGQTVYWKGILRAVVGDEYQLPDDDISVRITVNDDQGNIISEANVQPNQNGTLFGQIELSPEANSGFYFLQVETSVPGQNQPFYGGATFQVADFRTPEFLMTITPDAPEYIQGDTVRATVQADYFSGGPVADALVTWRLISEPHFFAWDDADAGRNYRFEPFAADDEILSPYTSVYLGLIREGTGRTGPNGEFTVELPADLAALSERMVPSQNWVFDVTIQTPSDQFVSARQSVAIHNAEYYIGISPQTYVSDPGVEQAVDLITLRPDGTPYTAAPLEITVYELQWNNVYARGPGGQMRWDTSVTRTEVYTTSLQSDRDGRAILNWVPEQAGQFEIMARGEDDRGNATSSSASVWISNPRADAVVEWPRANNDRIEIIADRDSYAPGDTARILIASPFSGTVDALLTVERGGVLEHSLHRLGNTGATLEIPITEDHIPNIYVGVVLIKGIDETNPTAAMRVGYTQVAVDTAAKELSLDIEPSAPTVMPGAIVTYTITARDSENQPVPNAEVSLALVDKAVLLLGSFDDRSLLEAYYSQRPLDVRTSATLIINRDRMSQQLSEGAKGGGGGGGMAGIELREEFADVALWQADATTDAEGQIEVAVTLPDNLTTWTLVARGVTRDTLVGDAQADLVATKPLQVRPRLPRFFTAGDRAQIGAAILNTTDESLAALNVSITVEGAEIEQGATTITTTLATQGQTIQTWPIAIHDDATEVVVTIVAAEPATATAPDTQSGDEASTDATGEESDPDRLTDALRLVIPVVRHEAPETVATAGEVQNREVVENIRVPQAATDSGTLDITIEPSLAAGMQDGLDYLTQYPYESTENTVSRFLPNLFNLRALRTLGIEDAELEAQLSFQLGVAVQRLISRQNQDGGWGYWRGERSNPFITTYVLWGLHNVVREDFAVPPVAINNGVAYLDRQFVEPGRITESWRLNEMAFAHFVLSEMDQGDPGRMSTLYDSRERLGHYGKALLAMALENVQPGDSRAQTLLDDLYGAANLSATGAWWQEESVDFRTLNSNTRTTAMVLAAFVRLEPDQPLLLPVIRWLMSTRESGHWRSPQETAWTLIALTDWLVASGELQGEYSWDVQLNNVELDSGAVTPATLREKVDLQVQITDLLRDTNNRLTIARSADQGNMYYTAALHYYLDALAIDARDRGIVVDRRFQMSDAISDATPDVAGDARTIDSAQTGDIVSVTVTIVAPTDLHHLALRIPVPAGLEPIDPALSISPYDTPMLGMELEDAPSSNWRTWQPVATDFKSEAVTVFATYLQAGAYEYTFTARAATPGEFRVLPAHAELIYFNEVWGRSAGALFTVRE